MLYFLMEGFLSTVVFLVPFLSVSILLSLLGKVLSVGRFLKPFFFFFKVWTHGSFFGIAIIIIAKHRRNKGFTPEILLVPLAIVPFVSFTLFSDCSQIGHEILLSLSWGEMHVAPVNSNRCCMLLSCVNFFPWLRIYFVSPVSKQWVKRKKDRLQSQYCYHILAMQPWWLYLSLYQFLNFQNRDNNTCVMGLHYRLNNRL